MRDFLDIAGDILAFLFLSGGAIGYLFRSPISEWIKHKFQAAVGRELEDHKHNLAKELEAYKGSLMRELEELRADIDIRRSIALRVADTKLASLQTLAFEFSRIINEACVMTTLKPEVRTQNMQEYVNAMGDFKNARRRAEVFLPRQLNADITHLVSDAFGYASEHIDKNAVASHDNQKLTEILQKSSALDKKIREEIESMALKNLKGALPG